MTKFCPNCGKEVTTNFCPFCGTKMKDPVVTDATPSTQSIPSDEPPVISFEAPQPAPAQESPSISFEAPQPTPAQESLSMEVESAPYGIGIDPNAIDPNAAANEQQPQAQQFTVPPQGQQFDTQPQGQQFNIPPQQPQQTGYNNTNYSTYYIPPEKQKESVTEKTWFIVLFLIIFWPLGLFFMWKAKKFSKTARVIITVIIGLLFILNITLIAAIGSYIEDDYYDDLYDSSYDTGYDYDYDDDISNDTSSGAVIDGRTAAEAADSYLSALNFSRQGLIEQLEYEGYSNADATAAVDACGADWNKQAAGSAQSYLDTFPDMGRAEMIDQLEYEGFTHEQAVYGAESVGL